MAREKMIRVHSHELQTLKQARDTTFEDSPALGQVIEHLAREHNSTKTE